jgi:uncharacterized repeat protein (TIGR01451 family)
LPAPKPAEPADPPTPVVFLCVRVLADVAADQELRYLICVENKSAAAAHHVLVRDSVPSNAKFVRADPQPSVREPELQWQLGTLEPGAIREIMLTLSPTGTGDVENCARVQFEHGQCVTTRIARSAGGAAMPASGIRLQRKGPATAAVGDTLAFQYVVTNTGGSEISGTVLTTTLPAGLVPESGRTELTWDVGTLQPGQSSLADYRVTAKATGKLCEKAVVTAPGGLRDELESCVLVSEPKLALAMTGPPVREVTQPAVYQLTVSNPGDITIPRVILHNPIPPAMTLVRASAGGRQLDNQVPWEVGDLEPGARRTVEIELRAGNTGRLCNRAVAVAGTGLTAQAEFCTDFTGDPGLLFEVVDTDDPVEVGGNTSYQLWVRNQGQVPATNVVVAATVPAQMSITRVTGAAKYRVEGQRVTYEPLTIPVGGEARYQIDVKAERPGDVRFRAELTADALKVGGPVREEESTMIYQDMPMARRSFPLRGGDLLPFIGVTLLRRREPACARR